MDGCQASLSPSWCEEAAGADGGEGSQDLEPLLPVGRAAVEASDVPSSAAVASVSDSSTAVFVEDPEIPRLLERIERLVADGFQETRVFEAQPHFIKDVVKVPFQLILTHSCVVLGPAGAGKTTLVKALGGEKFKPSVPAGPHLKNRTVQAQACDLQLEGLTDDLNFVLIDTPGWNHDTSTNIKSQYKSILKEKTLVSEHTPHIIVFCVPVSAIRQFQMKEAKKMSEELQELKFDKRFPIKVLPVATMADTQQPEELPELLSTIKDLAKKAFQETGAEVEEPLSTRFPPGGDPQGVEELSARLRQVLHSQLRSEEFCHLWQKAFAKGIVSSVREHCEKFPENDSTLRLFKKACCTVAAACGKQVSGLGGLNGSTATDQLPWSALQDLPTFDRQTWQPPPLGEGRSIVRMWGWASAAGDLDVVCGPDPNAEGHGPDGRTPQDSRSHTPAGATDRGPDDPEVQRGAETVGPVKRGLESHDVEVPVASLDGVVCTDRVGASRDGFCGSFGGGGASKSFTSQRQGQGKESHVIQTFV